jgi:hypothetical protein
MRTCLMMKQLISNGLSQSFCNAAWLKLDSKISLLPQINCWFSIPMCNFGNVYSRVHWSFTFFLRHSNWFGDAFSTFSLMKPIVSYVSIGEV